MLKKYRCAIEESEGVQFDFYCMADDEAHAREQAINAYPEATVAAVTLSESAVQFHERLRSALQVLTVNFPGFDTGDEVNGGDLVQSIGEIWQTLRQAAWGDAGDMLPRRGEELLALATTALRDKYVGCADKDIVGHSGDGLRTLLRDLVEFQRGQGFDDDGGWNCDVTQDIPVATPETARLDPIRTMQIETQRELDRISAAKKQIDEVRLHVKDRLAALKDAGLTFAECVDVFGTSRIDSTYVRAAQRKSEEGELEVDNTTVVSDGADDGAYVAAWLWVGNDEADECTVSAAIERMLEYVKPGAAGDLAEYVSWAEDLIENHADEIDGIQDAEPWASEPQEITWTCKEGKTISFLPSHALSMLQKASTVTKFTYDDGADCVLDFIQRYGSKLDRSLTVIPIASLLAKEPG